MNTLTTQPAPNKSEAFERLKEAHAAAEEAEERRIKRPSNIDLLLARYDDYCAFAVREGGEPMSFADFNNPNIL
ncbi:MAG TPA: hypothetical protein VF747_06345 [Blastocatellia bacterium]|jgi:hypothetical protein